MSRLGIIGLSGKVSRSRLTLSPKDIAVYVAYTDPETSPPSEFGNFCSVTNTSATIYAPYNISLKSTYDNKIPIYNDFDLTQSAPLGIYSIQDGGAGAIWYYWDGFGWRETGTC
jgi:hypothetical protein